MRNYICNPIQNDDGDFFWTVLETATDQVINSFIFEDEARSYARFLNKGGGFDGFTPSFVLTKVEIPEDINEIFAAEFEAA